METITECRKKINEIDAELLALFTERFIVTEAVGEYKKEHELAIFDPEREKQIIKNLEQKLANNQNAHYIIEIWKNLLVISKQQQQDIVKEQQ